MTTATITRHTRLGFAITNDFKNEYNAKNGLSSPRADLPEKPQSILTVKQIVEETARYARYGTFYAIRLWLKGERLYTVTQDDLRNLANGNYDSLEAI